MGPQVQTIIEDEEEFLNDVEAFHERRGTTFDRVPKIAGRHIPLQKLYKMVMERGGYDQLSGERMQWRTLVKPFGFSSQHEATVTFQLKTVYYKQLAAYEIATYWGEEPPPREILEDLTAKGGDLRARTLNSYKIPASREAALIANNTKDESSEDELSATPKAEKMDVDDPGSGSRYPTRQLRQDPKRTQMYQPESVPGRSRFIRSTSSPQPPLGLTQSYNTASSDPRNSSFSLDKYDPRQPMALTLRPVITPGNDPDVFYQRKALAKAQAMPRLPPEPQQFLKYAVPNGMNGPNIYIRCLYGLRSGIKEEQDFALHHLVKVSYERGDKYKFEGFPLLAESLLEKALEISELVYGIPWRISYDELGERSPPNTLNAAYGTPNLLATIKSFRVQTEDPDLESTEFAHNLEKLNETALVIRNMVTLQENAIFLSRFPLFRDFLIIAINLPSIPALSEYKYYALEMAEQVTRYWLMAPDDALYVSMLHYLESNDRGMILSALRAITRIGIETHVTYRLTGVPLSTIERLVALVLLEADDELIEATLDFLYEFTAIPENVTAILNSNIDLFPSLMPRLTTLLLHNAIPTEEKILNRITQQKLSAPPTIPTIPFELHHQLIQYPEPERSSRWLRCCFEESPSDDITQIAIWQAYQGRFQANNPIPAADFIKNVSSTFSTAQAQVINGPQPRFIIKGIRPRRILLDTHGRSYYKCFWEIARVDPYDPNGRLSQRHLCNQWQSNRQNLWTHIVQDHIGVKRNSEGRFTNDAVGTYNCRWTGCLRNTPFTKPNDIAMHIRSHLPETAESMSKLILELTNGGKDNEPEFTRHTFYYTAIDDRGHACGIPFMSVMVMRNLARFANNHSQQFNKDQIRLADRFFGVVMQDIWHVVSVNRTLRDWLSDLLNILDKGERKERRGQKREHNDADEEEGGEAQADTS